MIIKPFHVENHIFAKNLGQCTTDGLRHTTELSGEAENGATHIIPNS